MKMDFFHHVSESIEDYVRTGFKNGGAGAWYGRDSMIYSREEAERMAERGWPEGTERARRMQMVLSEPLQTLGLDGLMETEEYDVCGASVDVGLYCEGEPECMVDFIENEAPRSRVVKLYVQINCLASVEPETIMRRGAAIAAIVDALEERGLQIELWAVDCTATWGTPPDGASGGHRHLLRMACQVKEAGQPMPLDRIAFALGHPGFYRAISFANRSEVAGAQGGVTETLPAEVRDRGELVVPNLVPSDNRRFSSDEAAAEWAADLFGKLVETAREETSA